MANTVREFVVESLRGFYERLPFKEGMTYITYAELKNLRDASSLVPGMQYRITDYATTTSASNTGSAGHAFDIIVTALDESAFSEDARAIQHEGDTYFANSKLDAWELKYCLDNDNTRFDWADASNGKGVIYRMVDEFDNDLPYDFKNIQFKIGAKSKAGTKANVYYYTFSVATGTNDVTVTDHSLNGGYCYGNSFKEYIKSNKQSLNFIVCRNTYNTSKCYGNSTGVNCYNIACGYDCYGWSCGNGCYGWTCGNSCYGWTCGNSCYSWTCGNSCYNWSCGNWCYSWTCGDYCLNWTCGSTCYSWTCGDYCNRWSCGNGCGNWKFGNSSTKKNYYRYIMIDDGCQYFYLDTNQTASASNCVQNIHICQGILGTSSAYKIITVDTVNNDYQIEYKAANSVTNII